MRLCLLQAEPIPAIPKDKTKPFTPGFNSDLAVAGLKSAGDGQRGGKELIPPPSLPPPLLPSVFCSFSFQLAWFAAEKWGKQAADGVGGAGGTAGFSLLPPTFGAPCSSFGVHSLVFGAGEGLLEAPWTHIFSGERGFS